MTPEDVKEYYGSAYHFGRKTGMSHVTLYNWIRNGKVPLESQLKIYRITKGELKISYDEGFEGENI